ncbi:hypothetical protein E4U55_000555 [Claviceps digitariae]|nr:hypothetical protein E4U55_000555 [Claviceps digitariae]
MQLVNSAVLALTAIFAGQALADCQPGPLKGTVWTTPPCKASHYRGLQTWSCGASGSYIVHRGNDQFVVRAGSVSGQSGVGFMIGCENGPVGVSTRFHCTPNAAGVITFSGCPNNAYSVSDYTVYLS